jgi:hypothetical protein
LKCQHYLVVAGGTVGAGAGSAPASSSTDGSRLAIATFADSRKEGDGAGCIAASALGAWCCCVGLAHGTELLKGRLAVGAAVLVNGHALVPHLRRFAVMSLLDVSPSNTARLRFWLIGEPIVQCF